MGGCKIKILKATAFERGKHLIKNKGTRQQKHTRDSKQGQRQSGCKTESNKKRKVKHIGERGSAWQ